MPCIFALCRYKEAPSADKKQPIRASLVSTLKSVAVSLNSSVLATKTAYQYAGLAVNANDAVVRHCNGVIQDLCGQIQVRLAVLNLTLWFDQHNITACGTNKACLRLWEAKLNTTLAAIAYQHALKQVCMGADGKAISALALQAELMGGNVAGDLNAYFGFLHGSVGNALEDVQAALSNLSTQKGLPPFLGAFLLTASGACAHFGGASYHFGLTACPALCPKPCPS